VTDGLQTGREPHPTRLGSRVKNPAGHVDRGWPDTDPDGDRLAAPPAVVAISACLGQRLSTVPLSFRVSRVEAVLNVAGKVSQELSDFPPHQGLEQQHGPVRPELHV